MKDKLIFEKTTLPNGMVVYSQFEPTVDFAYFHLVAPVGSAHNNGGILPGSFHYLEHLLMNSSMLYPEIGSAMAKIKDMGGFFNAGTWFETTRYHVRIPTCDLLEVIDMVISQFFHPIITEEAVVRERGIIANERKRKGPYYPASDEKGWYELTQWKDDCACSVRGILGEDNDFEQMNEKYFIHLHQKFYVTDKAYCIIAGNFDLEVVCKKLEGIPLSKNIELPQPVYNPLRWNKKDFHEFATSEVSRFEYLYRWVYPINEEDEQLHFIAGQIIGSMLTDYAEETIYRWLRHEKAWLYEIDTSFNTRKGMADIGFMMPLNSIEQVNFVRNELGERVFEIMKNKVLLDKIKKRKRAASVFEYQTIQERVASVWSDLHWYGSIETMQDYYNTLDRIDTEMLQDLFINKLNPNVGELVIIPKK